MLNAACSAQNPKPNSCLLLQVFIVSTNSGDYKIVRSIHADCKHFVFFLFLMIRKYHGTGGTLKTGTGGTLTVYCSSLCPLTHKYAGIA